MNRQTNGTKEKKENVFSSEKEQQQKSAIKRSTRRQSDGRFLLLKSESRLTQGQNGIKVVNASSGDAHVLNNIGNHTQFGQRLENRGDSESYKIQEPKQLIFKYNASSKYQNNSGTQNRSRDPQEGSPSKIQASGELQPLKSRNSLPKCPNSEKINIKCVSNDNTTRPANTVHSDITATESTSKKGKHDDHVVHRIMELDKGFYLVFWFGWNFTSCTWHILEDLRQSPLAMKQFLIKEEGLAAVLADLNNSKMYQRVSFKRPKLPYWNENKWLNNDTLKQQFEKSPAKFGYWMYKRIEAKWMTSLDPFADFNVAPLYLECWHAEDSLGLPENFKFNTANTFTKAATGVMANYKKSTCLSRCFCRANSCCACQTIVNQKKMRICTLDKSGKTVLGLRSKELGVRNALFLCNDNCGCPEKEKQILPKFVRTDPLLVFRDPHKGWCLRALTDVPKGRILSEYFGMVSTSKEADEDNSYQYEISRDLVVDSQYTGNESRFFSHCCQPNVVVVCAYSSPRGDGFYRLVFAALKDIKKGEELSLDYHPDWPTTDPKDTRTPKDRPKLTIECRCSATYCRDWL